MDPKDWDEFERLFTYGQGLSEPERLKWFETLKKTQPDLVPHLEAMFASKPQADSFFEKSPGASSRPFENALSPSQSPDLPTVGNYQLIRLIDSGGMGSVFEAMQESPVARKVALKIIQPQCSTQEHWARFFAEKDILARMNHPAIAHLYDFGFANDGRPFFSMELVEGLPITTYCEEHKLDLNQRIRLFVDVCHGLMHAHQKMVIHRDLKPDNILVTEKDGQPTVKILDFGISKNLDRDEGESKSMTQIGSYLGTIPYLSPEQAEGSGLQIDTRTDIYALGVLLFELLTGTWPFDRSQVETGPLDQRLRAVRETPPKKPSRQLAAHKERLAELGRTSKLSRRNLMQKFQGDLDWIILRAMAKDPEQRYASTHGLIEDLNAFLEQRPVLASAPPWHYRLRKWYARNRILAISATVIGSALILAGLNTWRTNRQIQTTLKNQENAFVYLGRFLRKGGPSYQGNSLTVSQLVRGGLDNLEIDFKDDPVAQSFVRVTLANVLEAEGDWKDALEHYYKAYETRRVALGERDTYTLSAKERIASCLIQMGNIAEGKPISLSVKSMLEKKGLTKTARYAEVLQNMGRIAMSEKAEGEKEYFLKALRIYQECDCGIPEDEVQVFGYLMRSELQRFNYAEAEKWGLQAVEGAQKHFGPNSGKALTYQSELSRIYLQDNRFEQGLQLFEESVRNLERYHGADIPNTIFQKYRLALAYSNHGYYENAERLTSEGHPIAKKRFGSFSPSNIYTEMVTADVYSVRNCYPEAIQILQAIPIFHETIQKNQDANINGLMNNLATFLFFTGNYAEARWYAEEALERKLELSDLSTPTIASSLATLTEICLAQGDLVTAASMAENGFSLAQAYLPEDAEASRLLQCLYGLTQIALGKNLKAGLVRYQTGLKAFENKPVIHSMLVSLTQRLQDTHGVHFPESIDQ